MVRDVIGGTPSWSSSEFQSCLHRDDVTACMHARTHARTHSASAHLCCLDCTFVGPGRASTNWLSRCRLCWAGGMHAAHAGEAARGRGRGRRHGVSTTSARRRHAVATCTAPQVEVGAVVTREAFVERDEFAVDGILREERPACAWPHVQRARTFMFTSTSAVVVCVHVSPRLARRRARRWCRHCAPLPNGGPCTLQLQIAHAVAGPRGTGRVEARPGHAMRGQRHGTLTHPACAARSRIT